nr:hypothetical protein BaRGS_024601 [Batillaria attramentaria]
MDVFTLKENRIITSIPKPEPSIAVGVCKDNAPYLLCFIPSLPKKTISRATIRQTWGEAARGMDWPGKPLRHRVALVFVFGTADYTAEEMEIVRNESRQYGDVLASNMIDSYANLTLKMLVAMQWAVTSCPEFQFLLKADEDTFVNLSLLMDLLTELMDGGHTSFILGYNHLQHKPATSRQGRWNVSRRVYSLDDFPRYVYGHSYVTSADVLPSMLYLAQRMPYFPPEDAFLTGVLAVALNVTRIHSQRFAVAFRTMYTCDMLTERLSYD